MLLQQINSQRPLSYSDQAGQGESRGWTGVGRRIQRRTIKCYDGCRVVVWGDVEGKCQVREEWQRVGWVVNAECNMARIVAILELKLNSEKEEQSEVGNLLTVSPQFTDSPWTDRKQRPPGWSHVFFLLSFCATGGRCWPHYREQTLHWWKPVGHAKYLVQYFNISSGPRSHRV